MAGALELKGIGKHFGALAALRDINLQVGADELLVVLGPTGAGKTTLLRTVAVLSEGRILQVGRPETVYRKPLSPLVARQLGQPAINLLEVRRQNGAWVVAEDEQVMAAIEGEAVCCWGCGQKTLHRWEGKVPARYAWRKIWGLLGSCWWIGRVQRFISQ